MFQYFLIISIDFLWLLCVTPMHYINDTLKIIESILCICFEYIFSASWFYQFHSIATFKHLSSSHRNHRSDRRSRSHWRNHLTATPSVKKFFSDVNSIHPFFKNSRIQQLRWVLAQTCRNKLSSNRLRYEHLKGRRLFGTRTSWSMLWLGKTKVLDFGLSASTYYPQQNSICYVMYV